VERRLSAATQAQALAALQFLYRHVLDRPLTGSGGCRRHAPPCDCPSC
jgi:hypothetical protein